MKFLTLDNVTVEGKTVLVRVDINSPVDSETGEILDDYRIQMSSNTLKELSEKDARVVILAHQGRPGSEDFTNLKNHADKLTEILGIQVNYVDDIFGRKAQEAISSLEDGEILLLENVRFYPKELENRPIREQAKTELVLNLSSLAELYVNDAFGAAHRSQPSLVGFTTVLPTVAGRLMERELIELSFAENRTENPEHPSIYILGGTKVHDSLSLIKHVLGRGIADNVLTGGLIGNVFLTAANNDLGRTNKEVIINKGYENEVKNARKILSNHKDKVKMPEDVRIQMENGNVELLHMEELPTEYPIYDIGDETIQKYRELIYDSKTIVANGPVGVFEKPAFAKGTKDILKAMSESKAFTMVGGGHMVGAAREIRIEDKLGFISSGGGATLRFLSGEKLPVIQALEKSQILQKELKMYKRL